jgi:hypothetical protein
MMARVNSQIQFPTLMEIAPCARRSSPPIPPFPPTPPHPSVDNIDVPAGTYKLTITGRGEDFAATGDLDIRRGVTIRGEGARKTIIDGNSIDRVFHTPFQNTSTPFFVNIFGVKITGGDVLPDDPGGGIFHDADDATMNLNQSTVSGNESSSGGGIMAQRGPLNLTRSTVSSNRAPGGLGGGIQGSTGGVLTLKNTTVSGNKSKFGGGIISYEALNITDSTIAFNTAQQPGGGIFFNSGTATFKNAIVSNNTSDFAGFNNCNRSDVTTSASTYNLEKGTSCGFDQPSDINAGPRLGDLANNGGTTNTHALLAGSPAINAGGPPFEPTDQRGVTRPQGVASDIGAFEKRQDINVVHCPTGSPSPDSCVGTSAGEALIGRDGSYDSIQGGEGNDAYNGMGSCDALWDTSLTSSDRYLVNVEEFCNNGISFLSVRDDGGNSDTLDLSRFYKSTDFVFSQNYTTLYMDGPGVNDIGILDFFTPDAGPTDSIESFKFSDKTLTAQQVRDMIP